MTQLRTFGALSWLPTFRHSFISLAANADGTVEATIGHRSTSPIESDHWPMFYGPAAARRRCDDEVERQMEFVKLPARKQAPVDADCIRFAERADGRWKLTASALCIGGSDEGAFVSSVDAPSFPNVVDAEATGLAWAANVGVAKLLISSVAVPLSDQSEA